MSNIPYALFLLLLTVGITSGAHAEIYKWVDENGTVQFSSSPPPADTPVTTVKVDNTKARAERATWQELDAADEKSNEDHSEAAQKQAKVEAEDARRRSDCEQARKRATSLQRPRINEVAEDGTRRRIGEDERQADIKKAAAAVEELCD